MQLTCDTHQIIAENIHFNYISTAFFSNPLLWCIGAKKQLLVGMLVVLCILDDFWISEVAEHSVMDCGGVKGLELKDLHLCDGQAFWD